MRRSSFLVTGAALIVGLSTIAHGSAQDPLPPTHPKVESPDADQSIERVAANPADVVSPGAVIRAYYETVSGPKGQARDWSRFLSLFAEDAHFITVRKVDGRTIPVAMTPEEFVAGNRRYFERGGYFETEIHRDADVFARIAQVFSTYESRRTLNDPRPYARGINSFQFIETDGRWWIVSIVWDTEHPGIRDIPASYLDDPSP